MADVTIRFKGDERDAVRAADATKRSIGGIDDQAKRTGPNLKALGIVSLGAFAALGLAARTGFGELAEGQVVMAQTEAAIKSTGGVHCLPWARLGHPHLGDTKADCLAKLEQLISVAKLWGTERPIVNVETEIKPAHLGGLVTPEEVALWLNAAGMDEAAISTEGWLYDMHWIPLTRFAVLLQILPRDTGWPPAEVRAKQAQCEARAEAYGFEHVGSSVQTYPMGDGSQPDPAWFDLKGSNRSLIWGDNAQAAAGGWARWAG